MQSSTEEEGAADMPSATPVVADTSIFSGAAAVRIPIEVPPGRNKAALELALVCNSCQKNGWIGVGWSSIGERSRAVKPS
jgi:hypothetical protein